MRSSGGREKPSSPLWDGLGGGFKIMEIIFFLGQSMSYPLFHDAAMKTSKTHYPRRNLLSVPYSVRPDRIERGLRILRALRFSIAAAAAPVSRPQQGEFNFTLPTRA